MESLREATLQFAQAIGKQYVITDDESLIAAQRATFATQNNIPAIILPANTNEVIACVQIASRHGVPIYPISCGKNWGNGSQVPTCDGSILMDLHRMNRIIDFDEKLAYVTVEPGVTQSQLTEFLREQKSSLAMSVTGSSRFSSVVGNVLERGDSTGAYGERSQYVCNFEVVLPTGEVLHTGFGRFNNAKCVRLHRHGLGPSLDGLFLQSNLGVVTQMTLWLEPMPEYVHHILLRISDDNELTQTVDALHQLGLKRIFQNLTLWNDFKVFSRLEQYPFELARGVTPLPEEIRLALRKKYQMGKWYANIPLFSFSRRQASAQVAIMKATLKSLVDRLVVVKDESHKSNSALGVGPEHQDNLRLAYWRKKIPPSPLFDLDAEGCGLIWCMPLVPFSGHDVTVASQTIEEICLAHGFEPNIALVGTDTRTLKVLAAIVYDREISGEDERAMACHDQLLTRLIELGYRPYRLGIQSMHAMHSSNDEHEQVLKRLKATFDPAHILSPGRYEITSNP